MSIVCIAYNVVFDVKNVAKDLRVNLSTAKTRERELLECLLMMTKALPLGHHHGNIKKHLPYIIRELDLVRYVHESTEVVQHKLTLYIRKRKRAEANFDQGSGANQPKGHQEQSERKNLSAGASVELKSVSDPCETVEDGSASRPLPDGTHNSPAGTSAKSKANGGKTLGEEELDDDLKNFDPRDYINDVERQRTVKMLLDMADQEPLPPPRKKLPRGQSTLNHHIPAKYKSVYKELKFQRGAENKNKGHKVG